MLCRYLWAHAYERRLISGCSTVRACNSQTRNREINLMSTDEQGSMLRRGVFASHHYW
jgi:hypothetical protein